MADDLLGPIGGFLTSLINPGTPEATQDRPIASSTRVERTTRSLESGAPEPTTLRTSTIATRTTNAAGPTSTSVDTTNSLTSASLDATPIATRTASPSSSAPTPTSAPQAPSPTAGATESGPSSVNAGAIAGGVVGALAVIALLAFAVLWLLRRPRKSRLDRRDVHSKSYQGSVVSLVAYGKDVPESRPSTSSPWDSASLAEPKPMLPAHLTGPSIFVTDETDTKRLVFELAGSEPTQSTVELEGGQQYHAYRSKVS